MVSARTVRLLAVFGLALALRLVATFEVSGSAYHRYLVLDAATYHGIALNGDPREPYWQPPLYPWLLRAVYAVTGPQPVAVRVLQALFGALAAAGAALLAERLAGSRRGAVAGWIAGIATAAWGPLINADLELLPASAAALLVTAWLVVLTRPVPDDAGRTRRSAPTTSRASVVPVPGRGGAVRRAVVSGVLLGLMGLLVPTLAFVGVVGLLWIVRRDGWRPALVAALVALVPIAAVTLRNARYERDLVPVSYNGGINLWIGNNPDYPRSVGIRPGLAWTHLVERPGCEGARSRAGESSWFAGQALRFATRDPLRFARNLAWKTSAALSVQEIGRNRDDYAGTGESVVLRVLLARWGFPFIVLLPALGVAALAFARRRDGEPPLAGFVLRAGVAVLLASVVFFPSGRYRVPALPALVAFAAAGCALARRRDLAGVAALAIGLVPHGVPPVPPAETFYEIAVDLEDRGRPSDALDFYRQALAVDPRKADAHLQYGLALLKGGQAGEGRRELETALEIEPGADVAWQGLAIYWRNAGDLERARTCLEKAVALDGCNRRAHALLAQLLMDEGRFDEARQRLEQARAQYRRPDPDLARAAARLAQTQVH